MKLFMSLKTQEGGDDNPVHWFDERPIKLESVYHSTAKIKWRVKDS